MGQRVAEHVMRSRLLGPKIRFRVDLHGVSSFGPGEAKTIIRWEWVEGIAVLDSGVEVSSAKGNVVLPKGAFGFDPPALAQRLTAAQSITDRPGIIGELQSH